MDGVRRTTSVSGVALVDRIERICGRDLDERSLRAALLAEIRHDVAFDAYAWVLTDPETEVGTSPLAETPRLADLPLLIGLKYRTAVNRWTGLAAGEVSTLVSATGGDRGVSTLWAGLLEGYGVDDVLSTVFRDSFGCWGFLDLWRFASPFTEAERDALASVTSVVTTAVRRSLAATFELPAPDEPRSAGPTTAGRHDPVVLLVDDGLRLRTKTGAADEHLRALLPTDRDRAPVPAAALNVAAQLLAVEAGIDAHPPWARVAVGAGRWCTVRAARLVDHGAVGDGGGEGPGGDASIAVSIESSTPGERAGVYARVAGFTARETDVLHELVTGADSRTAAARLFVSEHTVQDHLKSMFAKAGVRTRPSLIARATGAG